MPASPPEPERRDLWLVEYRWPEERIDGVLRVYSAHRANVDRLGARGQLLLTGTTDTTHAVALFTEQTAAAAFVRNDPLVGSDLVSSVVIKRWSALEYPRSARP